MTTAKPDSIWSQTFALLCLTQLLGYAHNALLTPTIPLYVTQLGGSALTVGFVLASFAVTSVLLRPVIGHFADRRNEARVLAFGCALLGASLLFFLIPSLAAALPANALRGIGWAGLNTGGYALLAMIAPALRRAEASGYYSGVQGGANILFPALGLWLIDAPSAGFHGVMLLSGAFAAAGALASLALRGARLPESRSHEHDSGPARLNPFTLDREVLLPSALLFGLNLTYPATSAFLVLYARTIGIENVAWYFVASGVTSLLARPLLGRLGDRIGGGPSLAAGFLLEMVALLLLNAASDLALLLICGVVFALGNAIGSSTTLALAIHRANPRGRGKAMASFSIAYPAAAGAGALWTGSAVEMTGYFWMYCMAAAIAAAGLAVTLANWKNFAEQ
ncbi:MAG TPA: MFS transporter [Candidatus Binatia bacterium]|nr:MFS transporter [Candidatus Binatia bacterium]